MRRKGFTLIEILVVIGMIGILATTALVAINPLHQFAQARNAQRVSNVNALLNAIGNRIADHAGRFTDDTDCTTGVPPTATVMGNGSSEYNVRPCLVPIYISELPVDPTVGMNSCTDDGCSGGSYDTGYTISLRSAGRITVCAPHMVDDGKNVAYCLTR